MYMESRGLSDSDWYPYTSGETALTEKWLIKKNKWVNTSFSMKKYYAKRWSVEYSSRVKKIQQEIMKNGPVTAAF